MSHGHGHENHTEPPVLAALLIVLTLLACALYCAWKAGLLTF